MLFETFFHPTTSTLTYLLASRGDALLIDPVDEDIDRYLGALKDHGLTLRFAIDTHVHADHITALGLLREHTGCSTLMSNESKASCVSTRMQDGDRIELGDVIIEVLETPGHTDDSVCLVVGDRVFTGDTLLIGGTGRTDFQNGDARAQYRSLFERLLRLPDTTKVYPAHDYKGNRESTIGHERAHNPRLQVENAEEYAQLMGALKLASPKMMDIAVPANLACGERAPNAGTEQ